MREANMREASNEGGREASNEDGRGASNEGDYY